MLRISWVPCSLTASGVAVLENLIVPQRVMKRTTFNGHRGLITTSERTHQKDISHTFLSSFLNVGFNNILASEPRSSASLPNSGVHAILIYHLSHECYIAYKSHHILFNNLILSDNTKLYLPIKNINFLIQFLHKDHDIVVIFSNK